MRRSKNRGQKRAIEVNRPYLRSTSAFALYEVLMGLAIFAIGVLALGRAVENCLNATDRKSTRLNSSHSQTSYAAFCLKKKRPMPQMLCPTIHPSQCLASRRDY